MMRRFQFERGDVRVRRLPRRACARSAFSLIELLVTISIIALLLSLMLPALKRSLRQTRATVCMYNLRTIDQMMLTYRLDNNGWLPHVPDEGSADAEGSIRTWYDPLVPRYLTDMSVLICPEDPFHTFLETASQAPHHPDWGNASSYGLNEFILGSTNSYLANVERHPPRRPVDTVLGADLGPDFGARPGDDGDGGFRIPQRTRGRLPWSDGYDCGQLDSTGPWITQRHGDSINVLTMGGAVRAVRTSELMRREVSAHYDKCAAGDCTFCNVLHEEHYSFAHAYTYWWTGPIPKP